jgi:AraC-like DNA-binding protein
MPNLFRIHPIHNCSMRLWWAMEWVVESGWQHARSVRRPLVAVWYIKHGVMGARIDGSEWRLEPNTLVLIPEDVATGVWNAGNEQLTYLSLGCEFSFRDGSPVLWDVGPVIRQCTPTTLLQLWHDLVSLAEQAKAGDAAQDWLQLDALLRLWWVQIAEITGISFDSRAQVVDERVAQAIELMNQQLDQNIRLSDLADALHLSSSHLRELFIKSLGIPFREVLSQLRMKKAKHMLLTERKTVEEIAIAVGYNHANHFSRAFHRYEGVTPSEYRQAVRRL